MTVTIEVSKGHSGAPVRHLEPCSLRDVRETPPTFIAEDSQGSAAIEEEVLTAVVVVVHRVHAGDPCLFLHPAGRRRTFIKGLVASVPEELAVAGGARDEEVHVAVSVEVFGGGTCADVPSVIGLTRWEIPLILNACGLSPVVEMDPARV